MNRRVSADHLLQSVVLKPEEAVAIVQQLIHADRADSLTPPLGPPTVQTVSLAADGSVWCATSDAPFAVSDLASFLDAMLPAQAVGANVPGALRYTIARARMEVDAPPFDSVEDFSAALARHERGDRAAVVQRTLARLTDAQIDRRRSDPAITQLRRQLRDADVRVYDQQRAIDALSVMSTTPPAGKRHVSLVAGVLIGLACVGAGELMHARPAPKTAVAIAQPQRPPDTRVTAAQSAQALAPSAESEAMKTVAPVTKRVTHATSRAAASRDREPARPKRFQWLRTRFAIKSDPL
jgi:hypothetical protein